MQRMRKAVNARRRRWWVMLCARKLRAKLLPSLVGSSRFVAVLLLPTLAVL
jgi:hypothetical protein